MPFIDVSDLLVDPDFATTFTVERTLENIDDNGRASRDPLFTQGVVGVVVPDKTSLVRNPDGSRLSGSIQIYTQYRLTSGNGGTDDFGSADDVTTAADIVAWNGRRYTVAAVSDYSQFGAGFIVASADLLGINR